MKNILMALGLLLITATVANAQFSIGLKGGIAAPRGQFQDVTVGEGENAFNLGVKDVKFGTQLGGYVRVGNRFFIQPEVLFNSNRTDFRIGQAGNNEIVKVERYQNLDIPVLLGTSFGPFRLHAGPVAHYFLGSQSELGDVPGYSAKWEQLTWGWLGGLTIGRGRLSADIRYEGNFNKFGDHITFFGDQYNFSKTPSRLVFALNIALVK